MKVLVVEDNATARFVLKATLEALGHEVTLTDNGRAGLEAWRNGDFRVVVSDWMMPETDGLALCRAIRATHRDYYTSFILITALGGKQNYIEAMQAGVDEFMTKPFDEDQLQARLVVAGRVASLQQHVLALEGLLPICSYCKRIREGTGEWKTLELYVADHSDARFSHGVCPECFKIVLEPQIPKAGTP